MKLLILDGYRDPRLRDQCPPYRGTYRAHPTHCDELPDHSEINQLFFWFLEEGGEPGMVRDLTKALRFAELWNARLKQENRFEIMEVVDGDGPSESGGNFIGFDLSSGYNNSLLSWGLKLSVGTNQLAEPIRDLCDLLSRHYAPQLNGHGLFQDFEAASLCLRSMTALQGLSSNLFEGGDLKEFRPVGLYAVARRLAIESDTNATARQGALRVDT
jgi:hypothetical protein